MSYETVLTSLTQSDARYLVVGGIGVVLSGYRRTTFDLDLLPDLEKSNLERIITVMRECGYVPRVPANPEDLLDEQKRKAWEEEKRAKVFTYIHPQDPLLNVNLLIFAPISFADAFSRKQVIAVNNVPVYVASLDDLLAMKRVAGRVKDLYDIRILEKIKERREDERK